MGRGWALGVAAALALSAPAQAAEWSAPRLVSDPARGAWEIDVALNERGDAVAVFGHRSSEYESFIDAAFRPAGESWQPRQQLSDAPLYEHGGHGHSDEASVALDAGGRSVVAWNHGERTRAVALTGFPAPPSVLLSPDRTTHTFPWVGAAADGRFSVLWTENDRVLGAGWSQASGFGATAIAGEGGSVVRTGHAGNASGLVAATWQSYLEAMVVLRRPDGSFTSPFRLNDPAAINNLGRIAPAVTPDGTVVVAWMEQGNDNRGWLRVRERSPGGTWAPARTLAQIFFTGQYDLDIAASPDGRIMVAWAGGAMEPELRAGLSYVERSASGEWAPPAALAPEGFSRTFDRPPMLAFDAAGNAYGLTRQYDNNVDYTGRFWVSERTRDGTVLPPVPVSPPGIYLGHYDIAAGAGGRAVVAYLTGEWPWGLEAYVTERSGEGWPAVAPGAGDPAAATPAPAPAPAGSSHPVTGTEASWPATPSAGGRRCVDRALVRRVARRLRAQRSRLRRGRAVGLRLGCPARVTLLIGARVIASSSGPRLVPRTRVRGGRLTLRVSGGGRILSGHLRL